MQTAEMFTIFLQNLKISDERKKSIATHYKNATRRLNIHFRDMDSGYRHRLKVGSAGRRTAVNKTSDLDMLYIMPPAASSDYSSGENPQRRLLRDVKDALKLTFPKQMVKVDRLVVQIAFDGFHVEVQPVFENEDGSFQYPDTKANAGEGGWKTTRPRDEIDEMRRFRNEKSANLHNLCRMMRAWKNRNAVNMGGLLIDTLAWRFLGQTQDYDNTGAVSYGLMCRDFFEYLKDEPEQQRYQAVGSRQNVKVYKSFRRQAKRAYRLSLDAIEAYEDDSHKKAHKLWRQIFGLSFPDAPRDLKESARSYGLATDGQQWRDTEEFPDEKFADVDIRYPLTVDCLVEEKGFRSRKLRQFLSDIQSRFLPRSRSLRFEADAGQLVQIPEPYTIYWKVLNRGKAAEERDCIRGQIFIGGPRLTEHTSFPGGHKVWCYIVQNNIVVAQASIDVPIE